MKKAAVFFVTPQLTFRLSSLSFLIREKAGKCEGMIRLKSKPIWVFNEDANCDITACIITEGPGIYGLTRLKPCFDLVFFP